MARSFRFLILCFLLGFGASAARAQTPASIEQAFAKLQTPGAIVYLDRPGQPPMAWGLGVSDTGTKRPMHSLDFFAAGSITKMFVAVAVLKLAEEGRLQPDDPLAQYLPEFPGAARITLRHLLGASAAGCPTSPSRWVWGRRILRAGAAGHSPGAPLDTRRVGVARLASQPLRFEPGTRCEYSKTTHIPLAA